MKFATEIRSDLTAAEMWREFRDVIENSHQSWRWPNQLESIRSRGLRLGSILDVVYKMGAMERRVHYQITRLQDGKSFTYESQADHPLIGGGTVEILSKGNGSVLRWKGEYRLRMDRWPQSVPAAVFFELFFKRRFFDELAQRWGIGSDNLHIAGFRQTIRGSMPEPTRLRSRAAPRRRARKTA